MIMKVRWLIGIGACMYIMHMLSSSAHADALSDLDKEFRNTYSKSTLKLLSDIRNKSPVLINRLGEIALYRPKVEQPEIYTMDMSSYLNARSIAHCAVTLTAEVAAYGLGHIDNERLHWLVDFQVLLAEAKKEIMAMAGLPEDTKIMQIRLLDDVERYAKRLSLSANVNREFLIELGKTVAVNLNKNLEVAARSQLEQFKSKMIEWKHMYPDLDWDSSIVVVEGIHQARSDYLQVQFFDWYLHDDPQSQRRVIYAETPFFPPPLKEQAPTQAFSLLAKVMLDKRISASLLGGALIMQSDILGPAAERLISKWPNTKNSIKGKSAFQNRFIHPSARSIVGQ